MGSEVRVCKDEMKENIGMILSSSRLQSRLEWDPTLSPLSPFVVLKRTLSCSPCSLSQNEFLDLHFIIFSALGPSSLTSLPSSFRVLRLLAPCYLLHSRNLSFTQSFLHPAASFPNINIRTGERGTLLRLPRNTHSLTRPRTHTSFPNISEETFLCRK